MKDANSLQCPQCGHKSDATKKAAEQAISEAHKDDTACICETAHKLIMGSGFPYKYTLPIVYPTKGRVLLVITESVAYLPFEESGRGMNWRDCSLRQWLNSDFLASLPNAIKERIVLESQISYGRYDLGLFYSNVLSTIEQIFVLGIDDLAVSGKPLHEGIGGSFWLRDGFYSNSDSDKAWLGGKNRQDVFRKKSRCAAVIPAMLLQIE